MGSDRAFFEAWGDFFTPKCGKEAVRQRQQQQQQQQVGVCVILSRSVGFGKAGHTDDVTPFWCVRGRS